MNISIFIALGSLIVASIALIRTLKIDRKISIEHKKAIIRAKGYKSDRIWIVRIWNDGIAIARNIRFESDDIEKDDGIQLRIEKGKIPYPLLNKGDSFEIYAALSDGRNPVPKIKFVWDDEYKKDNKREQVLEF
ncbi:MAG: hypothetical protein LBR26_03210 [Prevotella sp.]|jgi:hypothetical protein|nr:hypothetical protein [Prevotella sp.]